MPPTPKTKKIVEKGPPGRPKHEVWNLGFRRVLKHCDKTHRTIHAAYCIICSKVLCNTASKRLSAHRRICSFDGTSSAGNSAGVGNASQHEVADDQETPEIGKITKIITPENSTTITFVDMDDTAEFIEPSNGDDKTNVTTTYTFIDNDADFEDYKLAPTTNAAGCNNKLDIVLAKFFIGCNIPFTVADSLYFKRFCTTLNPSVKPVTSENLAGPLLDMVYSKIHKDTKVSPTSVLLIDGWKNDVSHPRTITVLLNTESNKTIFMDNYELSNCKDGMQELTDITKSCIMEAYDQFRTVVYAVILGNNYALKLTNDDELWQFPCNLHILDSLVKDCISQEFMSILCKTLKQLNMDLEDLENKISSEMRWNNVKYIIEFCSTNLMTIRSMLTDGNLDIKISKDLRYNFFDDDFTNKIEYFNNFLDSISELSAVCQLPKSSIADAVEQWLSLQLSEDDMGIAEKVSIWQKKALQIHCLVANYLHPAYRGQKLTGEQMNKVEDFLLNILDAEGLESLQAYLNDEGIFNTLNQKENVTAKTYWSFCRRAHNSLATLALKLLAIPASITSNFSDYFNTIKNKSLKPDKMRKLFAVYYHLKENDEVVESS